MSGGEVRCQLWIERYAKRVSQTRSFSALGYFVASFLLCSDHRVTSNNAIMQTHGMGTYAYRISSLCIAGWKLFSSSERKLNSCIWQYPHSPAREQHCCACTLASTLAGLQLSDSLAVPSMGYLLKSPKVLCVKHCWGLMESCSTVQIGQFRPLHHNIHFTSAFSY